MMNSVGKNLSVLMTDGLDFGPTMYYAPADFQSRFFSIRIAGSRTSKVSTDFERAACSGRNLYARFGSTASQLQEQSSSFTARSFGLAEMLGIAESSRRRWFWKDSDIYGTLFRVTYPQSSSPSVP